MVTEDGGMAVAVEAPGLGLSSRPGVRDVAVATMSRENVQLVMSGVFSVVLRGTMPGFAHKGRRIPPKQLLSSMHR